MVERALVELILDEMKRQRYTNRAMQQATGIKPRTWSNYTSLRSPMPLDAVYAVAEVLGFSGSDLMRRAEDAAATAWPATPAQLVDQAIADMSPEAREEIRTFRREHGQGSADDDAPPDSLAN